MDLRPYLCWIPPIALTSHVYEAMRRFRSGSDPTFIPVLNESGEVVGILRDESLRAHMFTLFGHELVKRHPIRDFLTPCTTISLHSSHENALNLFSESPNPDGLVVLDEGRYVGVLPTESLLSLYEENRVRIRSQLLQSQKLEAIGTLAGGIAHDFNNILMPIQGYAELLLRHMESEGAPRMYAEQVLKASKRARDLVQQILAFSRQKEQEPLVFSFGSSVKEVVKLLRCSLPSTVRIQLELELEEDQILADPTQMHQVLMNLCVNAAYAMKENGGVLEIRLEGFTGPICGWSASATQWVQDHLCLTIRDTGCGIDSKNMERIFNPFFTTKPVGEGTGLGLAVVHGIVSGLGGQISVESEVGKGTTFRLYLPRVEALAPEPSASEPEVFRSAGQRILLVDDEKDILDLLSMFLRDLGYDVEACSNGRDALRYLDAKTFDLLLTDLTMPRITGLELAQNAQEKQPLLSVILLTGYQDGCDRNLPSNICEVLVKPVDLAHLAKVIAACLERVPIS